MRLLELGENFDGVDAGVVRNGNEADDEFALSVRLEAVECFVEGASWAAGIPEYVEVLQ